MFEAVITHDHASNVNRAHGINQRWARWDSNPRSTPCKGGVIAARPQAQDALTPHLQEWAGDGNLFTGRAPASINGP
jgi:hypothetical protein